MNRSVWLRMGVGLALPLAIGVSNPVHADELDADASLSLKLAKALRERTFMRAGVIALKVKTSSGDTYDVTGPVVKRGELFDATFNTAVRALLPDPVEGEMRVAANALDLAMDSYGLTGLGTPAGIKALSDDRMATAGVSIGYYLTDDFTWMVEAYVLAAPLKSEIYGDGINATGAPNGLSGKHILSTKLLPPTVLVGRYWGDKNAKFRPYTGLMATYAIFFDTKATSTLNQYVGGVTPGDTSVSLKNAFGMGPSLGFKYQFTDDWHVSMNVGSVKLKTQATLTTRQTVITTTSAVLQEYPQEVVDAINTAKALDRPYYTNSGRTGPVSVFMNALAVSRGNSDGNLGTYVRKQDTTLTSTLLMLSVGRSF